jgi:hypothetical protein
MVNKNYHKFYYTSSDFWANFGVIWIKKPLRNNLKAKKKWKISKWRAPIKKQNGEGPNLNPGYYSNTGCYSNAPQN